MHIIKTATIHAADYSDVTCVAQTGKCMNCTYDWRCDKGCKCT